ncbi:hypothetical protein B0H14DRAFT_3880238 [Mycena olivaceomarginata]|nr:hypothetical protein B0H14DRAFT_3880238 [Mycena olivaceomarginata]
MASQFLPSLSYPVTRTFPGRIFSSLAFGGAGVVLLFLTVLNAALAGYETVPSYSSNFNVTQDHWYDKFLPPAAKPKPGSLCDARLLSLGDTITTNYSMFEYSISAIDKENTGNSGFSYEGWALDNCDMTSLFVNADANTFIIDFTAIVNCKANGPQIQQGNSFDITARTDWSVSYMAGSFGSPLGAQKALRNLQAGTFNESLDARGAVLNTLLDASGSEFADRTYFMLMLSNRTTPQVPPLNTTGIFEWLGNGTLVSNAKLTNDTIGMVWNMVQVIYAAVSSRSRQPQPNNFLLNTSVIPEAIQSTFPQTYPSQGDISLPTESYVHSALVNDELFANLTDDTPGLLPSLLPLSAPGPAVIDGVYLCRFQRAKSPGSAFIAVLVATLSTFSAVWGIFLTLAAAFVKQKEPMDPPPTFTGCAVAAGYGSAPNSYFGNVTYPISHWTTARRYSWTLYSPPSLPRFGAARYVTLTHRPVTLGSIIVSILSWSNILESPYARGVVHLSICCYAEKTSNRPRCIDTLAPHDILPNHRVLEWEDNTELKETAVLAIIASRRPTLRQLLIEGYPVLSPAAVQALGEDGLEVILHR